VAKRVPRVIRLMQTPDAHGVGIFAIVERKRTQFYVFREIPCDIGGRGFVVHRLGLGDLYHVRVGDPRDCSCECLGFLRHGRCKHIQGLAALIGHDLI
jgi:SWIM zinc finger